MPRSTATLWRDRELGHDPRWNAAGELKRLWQARVLQDVVGRVHLHGISRYCEPPLGDWAVPDLVGPFSLAHQSAASLTKSSCKFWVEIGTHLGCRRTTSANDVLHPKIKASVVGSACIRQVGCDQIRCDICDDSNEFIQRRRLGVQTRHVRRLDEPDVLDFIMIDRNSELHPANMAIELSAVHRLRLLRLSLSVLNQNAFNTFSSIERRDRVTQVFRVSR